MNNSVSMEINVLVSCFCLGIICGIIFDLFKAMRYGKIVELWKLVLQDVLYYCIISVVIFSFILKVNGAELRGFMPVAAVIAFVTYRAFLSKYFVGFILVTKRIVGRLVKIILLPVFSLTKIIFLPFLKIKEKVLSKKTKIALTFKQFCFKIKCNVGMLCVGNKICKERKPCRRKQKP